MTVLSKAKVNKHKSMFGDYQKKSRFPENNNKTHANQIAIFKMG